MLETLDVETIFAVATAAGFGLAALGAAWKGIRSGRPTSEAPAGQGCKPQLDRIEKQIAAFHQDLREHIIRQDERTKPR